MPTILRFANDHSIRDWLARLVLIAVLAIAVIGVVDPKERLTEISVRGDHLSHAMLAYGISLALMASFRRRSRVLLAGLVLATGFTLEALQGAGWFGGDAQLGDLVADAVGVGLALMPALAGSKRSSIALDAGARMPAGSDGSEATDQPGAGPSPTTNAVSSVDDV